MVSIRDNLKDQYQILKRYWLWYRRMGLKNTDFSIISNNCTGGYIYQYFGLPYLTPTAGLFFTANDFVKIVADPYYYLNKARLQFIFPTESTYYHFYKKSPSFGTYPIARLEDIEVFFMHYKNEADAANTWQRRASRINFDNLLFLLTENEFFTRKVLEDFLRIEKRNKICLTYHDYELQHSCVHVNTDVKEENGNLAWSPQIVLDTLPWKATLNHLVSTNIFQS